MFKKLNKKAQQTAEYAILIALVVGAVIAMQTYAQRTIQARIRGASQYLASGVSTYVPAVGQMLGTELQYEPYYLKSDYTVTRNEETIESEDATKSMGGITKAQDTSRLRGSGGYQQTLTANVADQANW